ncbi:MAG TPA: hypothetical protein VM223_11455, partial [Planctomycetota bacterium]|nr:hypothetical protein [Planctomycetota bacterium]
MNGDTIIEEFSVDGKTITRNAEVDPSVPKAGESPSRHALRGLKAVVDMHCIDGDPQDGVRLAVAYFLNMDPVDVAAAEDYIKLKTGIGKEAIRAQFRVFKERFPEPEEAKAGAAPLQTPTAPATCEARLAEHFVTEFGGDFRWCELWGHWQHWDGRRWAEDHMLAHRDAAGRLLAERLSHLADGLVDNKQREAMRELAAHAERQHSIKATLFLAQPR